MKEIRAAVLSASDTSPPYAETRPLTLETLLLDDPGPGEVLVRVAAAGLCHSDLSVVDGSRPRPTPMVLGHEGAGVVETVGSGVTNVRVGDHVVFSFVPSCGTCVFCLSGRPALCTAAAGANGAGTLLSGRRALARRDGTAVNHHLGVSCFAEWTVASASSVVPIDADLDPTVAALFGCAMLTGVGAVINTAAVPPGSSVAIFGLGGVGMAAVLGARLAGADPIVVVDPVVAKHDDALALGATHALVPGDDVTEAIRELTSGGADFTFEAVGSTAVLATAYEATGRGGTTTAIGLPHPDHRLELPVVSLVAEERKLQGSYMGSAVPVRDVPRLVGLHRAGRLPVETLVTATLPPEEVNAGLDALATGEVVRQVLDFRSWR